MQYNIYIHDHKDRSNDIFWRSGANIALRNVGVVLDRPWGEQEIGRALDALERDKLVVFSVPTAEHYHVIRAYLNASGFVVNTPEPDRYVLR